MSKKISNTSHVSLTPEAAHAVLEALRAAHRGNLDWQLEVSLLTAGFDLVAGVHARELVKQISLWELIEHCARFAATVTVKTAGVEAASVASLEGIFEALRSKKIITATDPDERELERQDVERRIDFAVDGQHSRLWGAIVESAAFAREYEGYSLPETRVNAATTLAVEVTQALYRIDVSHAQAFIESLRALLSGVQGGRHRAA